jgi:hypothetical protein
MQVIKFIENMENFISELKINLENGKLNEETEVEIYHEHDDDYLNIGYPSAFLQLETLEEFIKDYALNKAQDNDELEDLDLDEDEWEAYTIDSEMLNNARVGKTVAIIC